METSTKPPKNLRIKKRSPPAGKRKAKPGLVRKERLQLTGQVIRTSGSRSLARGSNTKKTPGTGLCSFGRARRCTPPRPALFALCRSISPPPKKKRKRACRTRRRTDPVLGVILARRPKKTTHFGLEKDSGKRALGSTSLSQSDRSRSSTASCRPNGCCQNPLLVNIKIGGNGGTC